MTPNLSGNLPYFAYGSNLLAARLTARCPSARPMGVARLNGHRFGFPLASRRDGSGKAGLVAGHGAVEGRLFTLSAADMGLLDGIEGPSYQRCEVRVHSARGPCPAVTYLPRARQGRHTPFDWYLALILWGAREAGLSDTWRAQVRATPHRPDPEAERPGFVAARAAFAAAGITAWRQILG